MKTKQHKSLKPHFQPHAQTWEQQVKRALSVLDVDPGVLEKMKATGECSMTELDGLKSYMIHTGVRLKRDLELFTSGTVYWPLVEFVELLVKVALNEEPLYRVTPPRNSRKKMTHAQWAFEEVAAHCHRHGTGTARYRYDTLPPRNTRPLHQAQRAFDVAAGVVPPPSSRKPRRV